MVDVSCKSLFFPFPCVTNALTFDLPAEDETMVTERAHHTPPTFGVFFPSSICSSMVHLTALLDDAEVNLEGVSGQFDFHPE